VPFPLPLPLPLPDPEDPSPIILVPTGPIIMLDPSMPGPITLPDLAEPSECKSLEQQYHKVLDEMFSLQDQIRDLQETLRRTTDPQHKRELETQIRHLLLKFGSAIEKETKSYNRQKSGLLFRLIPLAGCNIESLML